MADNLVKLMDETGYRQLINMLISIKSSQQEDVEKCISVWQPKTMYQKDKVVLVVNDNTYSEYICKATHVSGETFDETYWTLVSCVEFEGYTEEELLAMLNLTEEELESLQKIINDDSIALTETWSSSKIYTELENSKNVVKSYINEKVSEVESNITETENKLSNYVPLSGGTMVENAKLIIPSSGLRASFSLEDDYLSNTFTADGIYIADSDTSESIWIDKANINICGNEVVHKGNKDEIIGLNISRTSMNNTTYFPNTTNYTYDGGTGANAVLNCFEVRNGICTVNLMIKCVAPMTTWTSTVENLPANNGAYFNGALPNYSNSGFGESFLGWRMGNNEQKIYFCGGTAGHIYGLTFSYPIKES